MDLKYICLGLLTILQDPNPLDPLNHEVRTFVAAAAQRVSPSAFKCSIAPFSVCH